MTKKNKSYWQQRAEAKVLDIEKMGLIYESQMKEGFLQASRNIQDDITKLYVRYAKDNKLSYAETLKYLRDDERAEFQHDLDYYIKNASNADYRFEHRQELQALSVRARVKRMEAMKARIILESEKLFNSLEQGTMALYHRAYDEAYHRTAFDVFQKVGVGMAFDKPSPNTIKTLLEYPWSGKSYSQSLWDMEKGFVDNLNRTLTAGLIQGKSVQELSRQFRDEAIGKDFYKGKPKGTLKKAQRLVRTETAFILNQATSDMYDELGVDEYEFLGTLDSKTCEHCGGLDGKHYVSDEKKIGINYPPMHPWCRCTTVPYFPEDEAEDIGQRIARGADGKNYYVSADMTYKEWRDGLSEDEKGKIVLARTIEKNQNIDKTQYEKVQNVLGKQAPKGLDEFRNLKYNDIKSWNEIKSLLRSKNYLQEQLSYVYNGERLFIPRHTVFDNKKVIAGANCETPIKVIDRLIGKHGGTADSWQKKVAKITSEKYIYDVHWYELDGVQYETKMKSRSDRSEKRK